MNLIQEAIAQENIGEVGIYYVDIQKSHALVKRSGLQLPGKFKDYTTPTIIIHTIDEKAMRKVSQQTETLQFKRWFGNPV